MRKLSLILLILLVLAFSVYAEDEMDVIIRSAKKITWKKDRAKMAATPALDTLKSFWIDTTKVTVGQFKKFLELSNRLNTFIGTTSPRIPLLTDTP